MVVPSLEAATILQDKKLNIGVVNMRFIKPLDSQLIHTLCSQAKIVFTKEIYI